MNYWALIIRFAVGLILVLVLVSLAVVFVPQSNRLRALQRRREQLEAENRRLDEATRELRRKQQLFDTHPAFVIRTAREAGMVMPHETIYKLTNAEPWSAEHAEVTP